MRYAAAFFFQSQRVGSRGRRHPVEAHRMVFEKKLREVAYFGLVDGELRAQCVRSLLAGSDDSLALRYPV